MLCPMSEASFVQVRTRELLTIVLCQHMRNPRLILR